jgi:hypothetical protein
LPSTVTAYVPGEPVQERVDVSEPPIGRLYEEREQETSLEDVAAERCTVAEKPCSRWRVTVDVADVFPTALTLGGSALRSKSGR